MAQKQNNNWCFGAKLGVDFNSGTPVVYNTGAACNEPVATVSDKNTGALLFYTNSTEVYNANHTLMPNGAGVGFDNIGTSTQGTVIVPFVDDSSKYYVFTLSEHGSAGRLSYSVVDMSLDGGLGDVVAGQKYLPIDSGFTEAMAVVGGCDKYWLVTQERATGNFFAYGITSLGVITSPVVSPTVNYSISVFGVASITFSPDGKTLGFTSHPAIIANSFLALHDFDEVTGVVSNGRLIDQLPRSEYYSCEFSPNGKVLYTSATYTKSIYQYDISLPTVAAITASKKTVYYDNAVHFGALKRAPDGNIYISLQASTALGRISNPNAIFPGCVYSGSGIVIGGLPNKIKLGLPSRVVGDLKLNVNSTSSKDTSVCLQSPVTIYGPAGAASYQWQDGSTGSSIMVSTIGSYWVRTPNACGYHVDTIVVKEKVDTTTASRDMVICEAAGATLLPVKQPIGASYVWSDGSTGNKLDIKETGTYWVRIKEQCLVTIDTIKVGGVEVKALIQTNDTLICRGDTVQLSGSVSPAAAGYLWSTGSTAPDVDVWEEGTYTFTANYLGCTSSDKVEVSYIPALNIELGNDTQICSNSAIRLPQVATSSVAASYLWQDGSTNNTFSAGAAGVYHVRVTDACTSVTDTIHITTRNCYLFFPSAFSPNRDGTNDIAHLIGDIAHVKDFVLRIYNRWGEVVYMTNDVRAGWDGYYKGVPAEVGAYYYFIEYKYLNKEELMKGDIILVR